MYWTVRFLVLPFIFSSITLTAANVMTEQDLQNYIDHPTTPIEKELDPKDADRFYTFAHKRCTTNLLFKAHADKQHEHQQVERCAEIFAFLAYVPLIDAQQERNNLIAAIIAESKNTVPAIPQTQFDATLPAIYTVFPSLDTSKLSEQQITNLNAFHAKLGVHLHQQPNKTRTPSSRNFLSKFNPSLQRPG